MGTPSLQGALRRPPARVGSAIGRRMRRTSHPVPGSTDVWNRVHLTTRLAGPAARVLAPLSALRTRSSRDPSRESGRARLRLIAGVSAIAVLATGTAAFAQAHKTVTLDVDGVATTITTYSGSVDGVLEANGVLVGERDTVAPEGRLTDGASIVVRHAHQVTVTTDGTEQTLWTTALTADEALDTLSARGRDVKLVASRSAGRERPFLAVAIEGPADVQVDGTTLTVPDGRTTVAAALDALGLTLGPLDTVAVARGATGRVQVVVSRVVVQDVTTTSEVAFASTRQDDATLATGRTRVATAGAPGVRTVVEHVTTVDGVETSRTPISDVVTQPAVDEVVLVGTKVRAVVAAAPVAASGASSIAPVNTGGAAGSLNWAALAACESGGNASIVSSSGKYFGLYQFSIATWAAVGGSGRPSDASADEQTARAQSLYNRSGAGQWPVCGARLFS